ncbi:hypothetical protein LWI28_006685 [Acer negundo]|uniref:Uncharacterized protein n=1 Tax=Acer negundo TaxID=4023 RepID=A0AAD5NMW9_ACENE|nr:hypothetical protein LWI28_006685 [Acer negundo]KAK4841691.1 hypothetical protein QYF36_008986 [Acer negundo]
MVLLFIPGSHSTARELADDVTQNNDLNENKQDNGQSKSGVEGSRAVHGGSATGNSAPSATVEMSPPSALIKIASGTVVTVNSTKSRSPAPH